MSHPPYIFDPNEHHEIDRMPFDLAMLLTDMVSSRDAISWLLICETCPPMILRVAPAPGGKLYVLGMRTLPERVRHLCKPIKRLTARLLDMLVGAARAERALIMKALSLLSGLLDAWQVALANCKASDERLSQIVACVEEGVWMAFLRRDLLNQHEFDDCFKEIMLRIRALVRQCGEYRNEAA
jgi:hypothetical protein